MVEKQDQRLQLRLTPTMYARLNEIRISKSFPSISSIGREAIRYYIEEQSDQIGSRRHFSRAMKQRLATLENKMDTHFAVHTSLQAIIGAAMLTVLDEDEKEWKPAELIAEAARVALQQHSQLNHMAQQLIQARTEAEKQAKD